MLHHTTAVWCPQRAQTVHFHTHLTTNLVQVPKYCVLIFHIIFSHCVNSGKPPLFFLTPCNVTSTGGQGRQAETQTRCQAQAHSHMQMLRYTHVCRRTVSGLCTQWGLKGFRNPNTDVKGKLPPRHVVDRRMWNGKTSMETTNLASQRGLI